MNTKDTVRVAEDLADLTKQYVERIVAPLRDRIAELEKRPSVKWHGTWQDGKAYREASLITSGGSLWLALKDTAVRPGLDESWRLIVKGGDRR